MKKATLSRILGLALALVLVLSTSVAFALPSGTSAIEGLPEMPTVPTMVTAAKGTDVTITLSEKLNWLNVINNWNWLDIINWSEDGLTGTYSTADMGSQPGYGNYCSTSSWGWKDWWYADTQDAEVKSESHYQKFGYVIDLPNNKFPHNTRFVATGDETVHDDLWAAAPGYFYEKPVAIHREEGYDDDGEYYNYYWAETVSNYIESDEDEDVEKAIWDEIEAARKALKDKYTALKDQTAVDAIDDFGWFYYDEDGRVIRNFKEIDHYWGSYRLMTGGAGGSAVADFAYDGEAADGTHVKYGRYGECLQIATTLTGVNFLGSDKTPVKTTVNWCPLEHYGKKVWNWYIYEITEEYEDGTKLTAHFSSSKGGKLLGTKAE